MGSLLLAMVAVLLCAHGAKACVDVADAVSHVPFSMHGDSLLTFLASALFTHLCAVPWLRQVSD